jgi:hypothetical protein
MKKTYKGQEVNGTDKQPGGREVAFFAGLE